MFTVKIFFIGLIAFSLNDDLSQVKVYLLKSGGGGGHTAHYPYLMYAKAQANGNECGGYLQPLWDQLDLDGDPPLDLAACSLALNGSMVPVVFPSGLGPLDVVGGQKLGSCNGLPKKNAMPQHPRHPRNFCWVPPMARISHDGDGSLIKSDVSDHVTAVFPFETGKLQTHSFATLDVDGTEKIVAMKAKHGGCDSAVNGNFNQAVAEVVLLEVGGISAGSRIRVTIGTETLQFTAMDGEEINLLIGNSPPRRMSSASDTEQAEDFVQYYDLAEERIGPFARPIPYWKVGHASVDPSGIQLPPPTLLTKLLRGKKPVAYERPICPQSTFSGN